MRLEKHDLVKLWPILVLWLRFGALYTVHYSRFCGRKHKNTYWAREDAPMLHSERERKALHARDTALHAGDTAQHTGNMHNALCYMCICIWCDFSCEEHFSGTFRVHIVEKVSWLGKLWRTLSRSVWFLFGGSIVSGQSLIMRASFVRTYRLRLSEKKSALLVEHDNPCFASSTQVKEWFKESASRLPHHSTSYWRFNLVHVCSISTFSEQFRRLNCSSP